LGNLHRYQGDNEAALFMMPPKMGHATRAKPLDPGSALSSLCASGSGGFFVSIHMLPAACARRGSVSKLIQPIAKTLISSIFSPINC
jgi:hypothetical protein